MFSIRIELFKKEFCKKKKGTKIQRKSTERSTLTKHRNSRHKEIGQTGP